MQLTLTRQQDNLGCTIGELFVEHVRFDTLERPWIPGPLGGVRGISCVPLGTYDLVLHDSEAHPKSFALVNEALGVYHLTLPDGQSGRTACLIHVANYVEELRGCVALGNYFEPWNGSLRLLESRAAVERFYDLVPWVDGHTLTIEEV
jgi:hypothetical protein